MALQNLFGDLCLDATAQEQLALLETLNNTNDTLNILINVLQQQAPLKLANGALTVDISRTAVNSIPIYVQPMSIGSLSAYHTMIYASATAVQNLYNNISF